MTDEFPRLEEPPCPVCGQTSFATVYRDVRDLAGKGAGVFAVQRCQSCSLVVTRPRPVAEDLYEYYRGLYFRRSRLGRLDRWYLSARLAVIERVRTLRASDRLLDVGCATGQFLSVAYAKSQCEAHGVEFDPAAIANAIRPDVITYHEGDLETADLPKNYFDIITLYQSLEHVPDPVATLKQVRELLAPGGLCLVEVPDFGSVWRSLFRRYWMPLLVPQHLFHFEAETLPKVFAAAGFGPVVLHRNTYCGWELFFSVGLWLWHNLDMPRPNEAPSWRSLFAPLLLLVLGPLLMLELPLQAVRVRLGGSSIRTLVALRD
jgi:SAM-dependent methyltransferase